MPSTVFHPYSQFYFRRYRLYYHKTFYGCGNVTIIPGYWFENGFTKFVEYCHWGRCSSTFNWYLQYMDG